MYEISTGKHFYTITRKLDGTGERKVNDFKLCWLFVHY